MSLQYSTRSQRRGFTLIELMVVIAIIGLLTALTAGAVFRYLSTQKGNVTETTLQKLDSELKKHWQKVIDDARNEDIPVALDSIYSCNGDAALQRVIYIKLRLMQQFPMNFDEVMQPTAAMLPAEKAYSEFLMSYGINGSSPQTLPYESSVCFLMALQRDRGRMSITADELGASIRWAKPPYLIDGWEQPISFYRWPTASDEVDQLNTSSNQVTRTKRDSQDPDGKLMDSSWWGGPGWTYFTQNVHAMPNSQLPSSRYLTPAIVSGGPNKRLGIDLWPTHSPDPMSINNATSGIAVYGAPTSLGDNNSANDNLYSFRLRLGGN